MICRALLLVMLSVIAEVQESRAERVVIANMDVTNPSPFIRRSESLFIPFTRLGLDPMYKGPITWHVVDGSEVVPTEVVDTDGDGKTDSVVFIGDYAAKQVRHLSVLSDDGLKLPKTKKQTQAEISIKEGGHWNGNHYDDGHFENVKHVKPPPQHTGSSTFIRYEGPGIESDKVAYRVYLDQRNGFDIFGKKISDMVLQNIGVDDRESYESDAPWGLDIFKVGDSLGAGGFGYWNGKQVEQVANTESREATIVANGDLYSAFDMHYNHWKVADGVYDVSAMISMSAGSRLAHNVVQIRAESKRAIPPIAIGVVKHPNTKLIESDPGSTLEWAYAASWGKQSRIAPEEYLGIGVLFHRLKGIKQTEDGSSYVSVMDASKGALDYYFFAAWDKEPGGIKSESEFKTFLDQEVERLSAPLQVMIARPHEKQIHNNKVNSN